MRSQLWTIVLLTAGVLRGQEIHMDSGEVIQGVVGEVKGSTVRLHAADGRLMQADVRSIDHSCDANGKVTRHAAKLTDGEIGANARLVLERLQKGEVLSPSELSLATANCPRLLADNLQQLLTADRVAVRTQAARALTIAATGATLRAVLDVLAAKGNTELLRETVALMPSAGVLAALTEIDAKADLEPLLRHKDRMVRATVAWVGAKLGDEAALPVLATFVSDPDHHVRESSAVCLAECGNDAGARILVQMAKRERSPAMAANCNADAKTQELLAAITRRERLQVCALLGALGHKPAAPVLRTLAAGKDTELAAAAKAALTKIDSAAGG